MDNAYLYDLFINKFKEECMCQDDCIDEKLLFSLILEQKMLLPLYDEICRCISKEIKSKYVFAKYLCLKNTDIKIKALELYLNNCYSESVFPIILKGSVLSYMIYDSLYMRDYNDLDILVEEKDFQKANMILYNMGFRRQSDIIAEKLHIESDDKFIYDSVKEIAWFKDDIVIEVKTNSGLLKFDFFRTAFNNPIQIKTEEICFYTLSIENTFIYLIWTVFENFYSENNFLYDGYIVRDIFDFVLFVGKYSNYLTDSFFASLPFSEADKYIPYVLKIIRKFDEALFKQLPDKIKCYVDNEFEFPSWLSLCSSNMDFTKGIFDRMARINDYKSAFFKSISEGNTKKFWPIPLCRKEDEAFISMYLDTDYSCYFKSAIKYRCRKSDDFLLFEFIIPHTYKNLICTIDVFNKNCMEFSRKNEFTFDFTSDAVHEVHKGNFSMTPKITINKENICTDGEKEYVYFYITISALINGSNNVTITNSGHCYYPNRITINE